MIDQQTSTAPARAVAVRFPTFEGLRAVCALGIVAYHAGTFTGLTLGRDPAPYGPGAWAQHLNIGVSIFFVLSGFLLFRPFVLAHLRDEPAPALGRYLIRRMARIYPAYWVALAVTVVVLDLELGDWWATVRIYALAQIYWGDTVFSGLVQAWSLCTEVSFYLFLPLWAAALARQGGGLTRRLRTHYVALGGLYLLGVLVRAQLRGGGHAIGYATLPANVDLFAIGMALAVASAAATVREREPTGLLRTIGEVPGLAWLAALCVYGAIVSMRFPYGFDAPSAFQEVARQVLFGLIAALVVAPGVFGPQDRGVVRTVLRWRPLAAIGVVSYGVYLWHLTAMAELDSAGSFIYPVSYLSLTFWSVVISVIVAAASWFGLERPVMDAVRRRQRAGRAARGGRDKPSSSLSR